MMGNKESSESISPERLDELLRDTHFRRDELLDFYDKFVKDYPGGEINKNQFIDLYCKFYNSGSAKKFAAHVFRTFDVNNDGTIDFREFICSLSVTTRGSMKEKLEWAFHIYDIDGNGYISRDEMRSIFKSVSKMSKAIKDDHLTDRDLMRIFYKADINKDGQLSLEEFLIGAEKNEQLIKILQ